MFSTSIEPLSENLAISRSVNSVSSQRYSYHYVKYERRPIEVSSLQQISLFIFQRGIHLFPTYFLFISLLVVH